MNKWVSVALVASLGIGCGGKDKTTPGLANYSSDSDAGATGGRRSTGGRSGTSTAGTTNTGGSAGKSSTSTGGAGGAGGETIGGSGGAGGADAGIQIIAPGVAITSPAQVDSPDTGPVLVDPSVTVSCAVTPGSSPIKSVGISMTDVSNKTTDAKNIANPSSNVYTASFPIQNVGAGLVKFACTATDQATPAQSTTRIVSTFIDHGPAVTITSPTDKSAVSGNGNLKITFTVTPVAIATADSGQQIDSVKLNVGGVSVTPVPDATDPSSYTGTINLADKGLFQSLPDQISVVASATNKREKPAPVTATASNVIFPDSDGPIVSLKQPLTNSVIGGTTTLRFTLADGLNGSGVKPETIRFTYGDKTVAYSATDNGWSNLNGEYRYVFDATTMDPQGTSVQAQLQITVSDTVGNTTVSPWHVYLDDQPPFVSLDPAQARITRSSGAATNCSAPFDPVGSKATSNLDTTAPTAYVRVRALVMEMTNWDGGDALFFAHVDPNSVWAYASAPSVPLLVRKSQTSATCILNPQIDLLGTKYQMTGVSVISGTPDLSEAKTKFTEGVPPLPNPAICQAAGSYNTTLCGGTSDMFYVMPQYYNKAETAIYATDVASDSASTLCAGYQWDLLKAGLSEGWVCLTAQASDLVGNVGLSAPIAVCLNKSGNADCSAAKRPTCTDGCTPGSASPGGLDSKGKQLVPYIWYGGNDTSGNPAPFVLTYSPL